MGLESKPIDNLDSWMRNQERLHAQQSRRRIPTNAADLLGPGFGPTGTQILDWNSDEATFNGFFWSPIGSINTPDGNEEWAGLVIAEDDNLVGIQKLWTPHSGDPPREYLRRWTTTGGETRVYTTWRGDSGWKNTGITTISPASIVTQKWKVDKNMVSIVVSLTPGADISVGSEGGVAATALLQVPDLIVPDPAAGEQGLTCGKAGVPTNWTVDETGKVFITGGPPSATIDEADTISVSGVYMR